MKTCTKCKEPKPIDCFYVDKKGKTSGVYHLWCKECDRAKQKNMREANPQKYKLRDRRKLLMKCYSMTMEDYDLLFIEQDGLCAICNKPEDNYGKPLCVDHCHTTGKIRGLLCMKCNAAIGLLNDDKEILISAIKYLGGIDGN